MANVLKMSIVEAIHSLRSAGLSCREIARRLGIHRETVSRHLRLAPPPISKPASEPIFPAGTSAPVAGFEPPQPAPASRVRQATTGGYYLESGLGLGHHQVPGARSWAGCSPTRNPSTLPNDCSARRLSRKASIVINSRSTATAAQPCDPRPWPSSRSSSA